MDGGHYWSPDEQHTLEHMLKQFEADPNMLSLEKYTIIASKLPHKSIRDVALRVKWMTRKDANKRKKTSSDTDSRKKQVKRETGAKGAKAGGMHAGPHSTPGFTGPTGHLLEQNLAIINQIKQNMLACKVAENTELLARIRDNIVAIMSRMGSMPGIMRQMSPLPVSLNFELANKILPPQQPPQALPLANT